MPEFQKGEMMTLKCILALGFWLLTALVNAEEAPSLKTENEKVSYAIGVDMARNSKRSGLQLDLDALVSGLRDIFSGQKLLMSEVDLRAASNAYLNDLKEGKAKNIAGHVSYAVGVDMARKFKPLGIELEVDVLAKGFRDVFSGEKLLMDYNELRQTINVLQAEMRQKRSQARMMMGKDRANKRKTGEAFLAENKTKEGVMTLPSGVQYKILKAADGRKPTGADTVECNYRGTLIDGTEFDATEPGKPANLKVAQMIPGWKEAMQLMPAGSKWQIFIPPELTSGEPGMQNKAVGPSETLIFEVELVAIK